MSSILVFFNFREKHEKCIKRLVTFKPKQRCCKVEGPMKFKFQFPLSDIFAKKNAIQYCIYFLYLKIPISC